ncbi:MAG: peptidoglycan DD-metalloendopeptidase family protein [Pseudomonadota bacterium]
MQSAATSLENAQSRAPEAQAEAFAQAISAYERSLADLRGAQRSIRRERDMLAADLALREQETATLLSALQRIERAPAPLLLLHPAGPDGAARAGMMIREALPELQARVDALASDLAALERLQQADNDAAEELGSALAGLRRAEAALQDALVRNRTIPDLNTAALADVADNINGTLGALVTYAEAIDTPLSAPNVAQAPKWPLDGRLTGGFGATENGSPRPGILLSAPAGTAVLAPTDASVRFAGAFLGYGGLVILEPADDTLLVLAGLEDLSISAGDTVIQNEILGALAPVSGSDEVFLMTRESDVAADRSATLYIELRRAGEPIDPASYFAVAEDGEN